MKQLLAYFITFLLNHFEIVVDSETLVSGLNGLFNALGVAMMIFGQVRRKDLSIGLLRKY